MRRQILILSNLFNFCDEKLCYNNLKSEYIILTTLCLSLTSKVHPHLLLLSISPVQTSQPIRQKIQSISASKALQQPISQPSHTFLFVHRYLHF